MRATRFVESYFDAWNQCDAKGVADHLTDDGIYRDVPENSMRSHDEWITYLGEFFSSYRHRYELIGEALIGSDTIAFQYKVYPADADQECASGDFYRGAEFMTLHGDAAMTITDYYDIPGMGQHAPVAPPISGETKIHKYAKSGLNSDLLLEYKLKLEKLMQYRQAFLSSDLTLPSLAEAVGCSVNHLSQVINSGFGMSFFDYLNEHRIEHARELLANSDIQSGSILNIAFTVGFNSNSAFYAAFKKCIGQTPAQYRRAQLKRAH
jgi:AraC-like DNA-binding protein